MTEEKFNDEIIDPAATLRTAITMMVQSRLEAQKALRDLKQNAQSIDYENAITELEDAVDAIYGIETSLGGVHQFIIVGLATEGVML